MNHAMTTILQQLMQMVGEQDPLRWLKVASLLPGKNHEDVRYRYQRLVYDVHKIENAMPVIHDINRFDGACCCVGVRGSVELDDKLDGVGFLIV